MFMPMEKPKDRCEVRNRVGIMLGLVDRSDEVVFGDAAVSMGFEREQRKEVEQRVRVHQCAP